MAIVYPSSLDTLVNPTANSDTVTISHSGQHSDINDAVEALEAKVGADSSAVTSSIDYKINHLTTASVTASTDKKYVTDAQLVVIGNTSGSNTGDVVKASGAEVNTGTDDAKFVTAKALTDSDYAKTSDITFTADSSSTVTNKRIEPRIVTATSYTTDTGTSLSVATADEFDVTAQAGALKFNNPGGTPVNGQKLIIRIKDNGTARALTYDTQFRASTDLALPTTTVLSKTLYMGFIYNSADTKWDLLAVLNNF